MGRKMNLTAKPVIRDKFWIVEAGGEKVATLQAGPDGLVLCIKDHREKFASIKTLTEKYNIKFDVPTKVAVPKKATTVYDFPCNTDPFNIVFDVKRQLPLFTKSEKSKSYYCAGYYIIKFENGWVRSFCPKSITLSRYEFKGPLMTKLEMLEQLRLANG